MSYFVVLTMCDGKGNAGPYSKKDDAIDAMMVSVAWRQKNCNEDWRKTDALKWASTNGHTLEVVEDE